MTHKEDDILEELVERFQYNLHRSKKNQLNDETKKMIFFREIRDEHIEVLNLMGRSDISLLDYNELCELCK